MLEIEYTDTPPNGMSYQEWMNESCCTCYGCKDCEHQCNRTEQERAEHIAYMDDPSNFRPLTREESERLRRGVKKLIIPTTLSHIEYPEDLAERGLLDG